MIWQHAQVFVYTSSTWPGYLLGRDWVIRTTKLSLHWELLFTYSCFFKPTFQYLWYILYKWKHTKFQRKGHFKMTRWNNFHKRHIPLLSLITFSNLDRFVLFIKIVSLNHESFITKGIIIISLSESPSAISTLEIWMQFKYMAASIPSMCISASMMANFGRTPDYNVILEIDLFVSFLGLCFAFDS